MFRFIGKSYLLFAFFLFDAKAPSGSTGWSVFYFTSIFLAIALIDFDDVLTGSKLSKMFYSIASLILIGRASYEFSLRNLKYEDYMLSANSEISKYVFGGVTLFMFMGLCLKYYKNGRS